MSELLNIVCITRTESPSELADPNSPLRELVRAVRACGISDCYVVLNDPTTEAVGETEIDGLNVRVVHHDKPTSPTAMNTVLDILEDSEVKPDGFLAVSKEIDVTLEVVDALRDAHRDTDDLLVAGPRFKHPDSPELDVALQEYYEDDAELAYQVPWNTFALWNYSLFAEHVGRFDPITEWDGTSKIDTASGSTNVQGMEDGLAVAQGAAEGLQYSLLPGAATWRVNPGRETAHLQKLARKSAVLSLFMERCGYTVDALAAANAARTEALPAAEDADTS